MLGATLVLVVVQGGPWVQQGGVYTVIYGREGMVGGYTRVG